ncbi:MAG: phytanoyl-CoA dioxygenase family protein [Candidatus Poribacteria bacterium]|nr:phytanoyl-CoA dioxygenase family protein [Candidatus Poribacteria bacterium]
MLTDLNAQQFQKDGYFVVEGVLEGEALASIRAASLALVDADPPDTQRRVWHERVLFRRKPFRDLFRIPRLTESARALMGDDVQLLALDLLYVAAGEGNIGWHRDVTFVCNKTISMNTGIYLDDMTDERGPLRVVPGSHQWEDTPLKDDPRLANAVEVPVKAGTAVFFDAALWHTGGTNRTDRPRLALFPYFGRYWVKRMDNYFTQPLPADLLASDDPMTRQLLGLGLRKDVASYHGDNEGYNRSRGEAGIDFPD